MIAALKRLARLQALQDESTHKPALDAFMISSKTISGWRRLFASHPPLDQRIEALENSPR